MSAFSQNQASGHCGNAASAATKALFHPETRRLYDLDPKSWHRLQSHALTTAFGCSWLSVSERLGQAGTAFLAGMFHDVGKLVAMGSLMELDAADALPEPLDDAARDMVLEAMHVELGVEQLEQWTMPAFLIEICATHHTTVLAEDPERRVHHVVRLVARANAY